MGLSQLHQKAAAIDKGKGGSIANNMNTVIFVISLTLKEVGMSEFLLSLIRKGEQYQEKKNHFVYRSTEPHFAVTHFSYNTFYFLLSFAEYFSTKIVQFRRQQTK